MNLVKNFLFFLSYPEALDWKVVSKEVYSSPKAVTGGGDRVVATGRWKTTVTKSPNPRLAAINTTYISCNKQTRTCQEATAILYTPEDFPKHNNTPPFLSVLVFDFKIIDWSGDTIRAKHEAPVADVELRISVKDGVAERTFRETKARGNETSNPDIFQTWILE